jgi:hypothetical protein
LTFSGLICILLALYELDFMNIRASLAHFICSRDIHKLSEHSMANSRNISKFLNSSSADLNVSAELEALKTEVNNKFTGKFFRKLDSLKVLCQQKNIVRMSDGDDNDDNSDVQIGRGENSIMDRIFKLERDFTAEVTKISDRIDRLISYVKDNTQRVDDIDQERRAQSLIFQGVSESDTKPPDQQILEIMKNKLEIFVPRFPCCEDNQAANHDLTPPYVIARAFRMGKPRTAAQIAELGPRPILVNFGSLYYRDKVFKSRSSLRGTKIYVSESLTKPRYELLRRAKELVGNKNAWSAEGKIFAIIDNTKRRIIKLEDLQVST